jgi:hypothetical protein
MRKHPVFRLLLIFMFSLLASIYPTHATSLIGLDQKKVNINAVDEICFVGFGGRITSWKDGNEYVITIDDDLGVAICGVADFWMPYYFDNGKDSPITKIEYSLYSGSGTIYVLQTTEHEHVEFQCYGWAGWHIHIECRFQNYGDSYVTVETQVCTGERSQDEDVVLSLSKVKAFLYLSASSGGTTNPAPGTYAYGYGESVTVTASAYAYHTFDGWILDGNIIVYDNPITVTMDSDHTLDAYFSVSGGGDGGGGEPCPTLFVWDGNDYVDYGVIDIHNPSGEDVVREVPVQSEDVSISNYKAKFRLREGWEGLSYSESVIDQVKLYAIGNDGNRHLCPLISAEHSRLGNVLPQLLLSDDYRAQMLLLETVDLTFVVPWQNIQGFTFAIEGCNKWKM